MNIINTPSIKIKRQPRWLNSQSIQHLVLVRDASASMRSDTKQISELTVELCEVLAQPANKDGFLISVIDFNSEATLVQPVVLASSIPLPGMTKYGAVRLELPKYAPAGRTNITKALTLAREHLLATKQADQSEREHLKPVVLLFSDGKHVANCDPRVVADALKSEALVVSCAIRDGADEALLRDVATSPQHFRRFKSAADLRSFFAVVGQTMASSILVGDTNGALSNKIAEIN